jgi:hypothetical protein
MRLRLRHRQLVQLAALCFVAERTLVLEPDEEVLPRVLDVDAAGRWWLTAICDGPIGQQPGAMHAAAEPCGRGVVFMHEQGSAHLDIKPDNVLLDDASDPQNAVLADLGLVQQVRYTRGSVLPSVARCPGMLRLSQWR